MSQCTPITTTCTGVIQYGPDHVVEALGCYIGHFQSVAHYIQQCEEETSTIYVLEDVEEEGVLIFEAF